MAGYVPNSSKFRENLEVLIQKNRVAHEKAISDSFRDAVTYATSTITVKKPERPRSPMEMEALQMLAMRMRWASGQRYPVQHISAYVDTTLAVVFIVHNGKEIMLKDDVNLFPSDKLITELRLIMG